MRDVGISRQLEAVGRTMESEFDRLDRKMDVGFEQVRADIRQLAELVAAQGERLDREMKEFRAEVRQDRAFLERILDNHERRITSLESPEGSSGTVVNPRRSARRRRS